MRAAGTRAAQSAALRLPGAAAGSAQESPRWKLPGIPFKSSVNHFSKNSILQNMAFSRNILSLGAPWLTHECFR
jgi:hypothetical protein